MQLFKVGEWVDRDELFRKLVGMQYARNDTDLTRGTFRVKGEMLEIFPAYAETAYRIALFGDEVESIQHFDPLTGEILDEIDHVAVWPATHYVTEEETIERAVAEIKPELDERVAWFEERGKELEAHRLRQRTEYDIEMLKELGFAPGIENYSRILDGRAPRAARRTRSSTTSPTTSSSSSTSRIRRSRSSAACTRATARASRPSSTTASGCRRRSTTGRSGSTSSSTGSASW